MATECGHRWGVCQVLHAGHRCEELDEPKHAHRCYCGHGHTCTLRWGGPCTVYMHGHRCANPPDRPHQCACGAVT